MKITHALLGEHGALYPLLDAARAAANEPQSTPERMLAQTALLRRAIMTHAALEDDVLRPAIQRFLPAPPTTDGIPALSDHENIGRALELVLSNCDVAGARAALLEALSLTEAHFRKEESIIFPLTERSLSEYEQERLGAEWAARRRIRVNGFSLLVP